VPSLEAVTTSRLIPSGFPSNERTLLTLEAKVLILS